MRIVTAAIAYLGLAAVSGLAPVYAQSNTNCAPGRDLVTIPEIVHKDGKLRGVVILADEERWLAEDAAGTSCNKQHLRYFKGYSLQTPTPEPWPSTGAMLPGPTLRARVGDLVELAFLNQIDIRNFPFTLDQGERGNTDGCDSVTASLQNNPNQTRQIYPINPDQSPGDSMPNCIHGSSTANIHYHGTHTTPSTIGDNVLLYVRPALRDSSGRIVGPTDSEVMKQIEEVWARCEREGPVTDWQQMPESWRKDQEKLLKQYDATAPYKGVNGNLPQSMKLWPQNQKSLDMGLWPQYSLGAFPYCFPLPDYAKGNVKMGQAPGTHWYHAHKHGSTALNVGNGMAGALIIEGPYDDELKAFYKQYGLKEKVLVIQQLETALLVLSAGGANRAKTPLSVNGQLDPVVTMRPGEVQLWRIINASGRTFVQFDSFSTRGYGGQTVQWRQIAQDGVQFAYENYQRVGTVNNKFNLAGANRADLLVKAPMHAADYVLSIIPSVSDVPDNPPETLLTVRVQGESTPMDFIQTKEDFPKLPPFLEDIKGPIYKQRTLVYDTDPGPGRQGVGKMPQHKINGKQFDGKYIEQLMDLDSVEEWKLVNGTVGIAHPFHIHINPFQIVEVFQPTVCDVDPLDPSTWKPCQELKPPYVWWDTFAIPSAKSQKLDASVCTTLEACPAAIQQYTTCDSGTCTVKIPGWFKMRSMFADFTGEFVNHCHILAHEDRGMMQLIAVAEKPKNHYAHN